MLLKTVLFRSSEVFYALMFKNTRRSHAVGFGPTNMGVAGEMFCVTS